MEYRQRIGIKNTEFILYGYGYGYGYEGRRLTGSTMLLCDYPAYGRLAE
jgi:hypothetical protein